MISQFSLSFSLYGLISDSVREITNYLKQSDLLNSELLFEIQRFFNYIPFYLWILVIVIGGLYYQYGIRLPYFLDKINTNDGLEGIKITWDRSKRIYYHLYKNNYYEKCYNVLFNELDFCHNNFLRNKFHDYDTMSNLGIPDFYNKYYFNDTKAGVTGYIQWEKSQMNEYYQKGNTDSISECIMIKPYLRLVTNEMNPIEYFKYIVSMEEIDATISTFYIDTSNSFVSVIDTYPMDNIKNNQLIDKRKAQFIDTFFHPHIDNLWTKLKTVAFNPERLINMGQYPQYSMLLYGPPGTGKSTFAYRIARALRRNIVKVDLRKIKSKKELIYIFMGKNITYTKYSMEDSFSKESFSKDLRVGYNKKNSVYILDEFDIAVNYLNNRSQYKRKMKEQYMKHLFEINLNLQSPNLKSNPNNLKSNPMIPNPIFDSFGSPISPISKISTEPPRGG